MSDLQYSVPGMTCGHCVSSVTEEVEKVNGVTAVDVNLDTKIVTISGGDLDDAQLSEAIKEAGYDADALSHEKAGREVDL